MPPPAPRRPRAAWLPTVTATLLTALAVLLAPPEYRNGRSHGVGIAFLPEGLAGALHRAGASRTAARTPRWRRPYPPGERPVGLEDAVAAEKYPVCAASFSVYGNCRRVKGRTIHGPPVSHFPQDFLMFS